MSRQPFPEAIPTALGWAHPLTGEQLDSTKGLPGAVDYYKPNARNASFLDPEGETEFLVHTVVTGRRVRFAIHSLRTDIVGVTWDFGNGVAPAAGGKSVIYDFGVHPQERTYSVTATVEYGEEGNTVTIELETDVVVPAKTDAVPATLTIGGVTTVGASATTQLTLTAAYPKAGNYTVTSGATWTSSDPSKATVNSSGLVTGVAAGSTVITSVWRGVTDTHNVTVTEE